jgi:hypothetical protein
VTISHFILLYFVLLISLGSALCSFYMAMKVYYTLFELESLISELNHEIDPLRTEEDEK